MTFTRSIRRTAAISGLAVATLALGACSKGERPRADLAAAQAIGILNGDLDFEHASGPCADWRDARNLALQIIAIADCDRGGRANFQARSF